MAKLRIKQIKSGIGRPENHKRTLRALGLRKLNAVVEHDDKPEIRGMIATVRHLVETEEV
ncbi:MAG: 50S ribosomal protein L30 [Candidatus Aquicultorales bacterium]